MILRDYQREAVNSIYSYFERYAGNPLIVMPTASGKSFVLAAFIREVLNTWSDQRILILTHVKELIRQDYNELISHWEDAPAGVYSAGLKRRDADSQILFAGIQSVHKYANQIGKTNLIFIDECHLVPRNSNTMYRRFLDEMLAINPTMKIIGLTATHYRLDSGMLTEGEDRIFTDVAYEVPIKRLIEEGYLAPLITKEPNMKIDLTGVHSRGGDFIPGELQDAVDTEDYNKYASAEICHYGRGRKAWLVFCTGIDHAFNVRDMLRSRGIKVETITGKTNSFERDLILQQFKHGEIKAITNCDLLTTGFNHPPTDLLAILRPTKSTGLYVQIAGRGMRMAPGKENCLVLDFAGNIERHGPIDMVQPKRPGEKGGGEAPVKTCPKCQSVVYAGFRECPDCGFQFPEPKPEISNTATSRQIISSPEPFWVDVIGIRYSRHKKAGKPDSLKVQYEESSFSTYSEWICIEHGGYAQSKAQQWLAKRSRGDITTVADALAIANSMPQAARILVKPDGRFNRIVGQQFGDVDYINVDSDELYAIAQEEARSPFEQPTAEEEELPF